MSIVICDLDGTLCDTEHRDHLARQKRWDDFNTLLVQDRPHQDVVEILKGLNLLAHEIVFITGRMATYERQTHEWLRYHLPFLHNYKLLMRPKDDLRKDLVIKRELFETNCDIKDTLFVLEDRDHVVEMWRSMGLRCHQVQHGAY